MRKKKGYPVEFKIDKVDLRTIYHQNCFSELEHSVYLHPLVILKISCLKHK